MDRPLVLSSPTCLQPLRVGGLPAANIRPAQSSSLLAPSTSGRRSLPPSQLTAVVHNRHSQLRPTRDVASFACTYGSVHAWHSAGSLGLPEDLHRHYLLGSVLGSGAYGTVRYCYNKHSAMDCAVKVLPKVRGNAPLSRTLRKLQREIQMHSRVQECAAVATLYDVYEDETNVYMIMEYCRGQTLENYLLANGALREREAAIVMYECLKVIAGCHAKGVLHGDVKPANWVFTRPVEGSVEEAAASGKSLLKAIDFGCSQKYTGQPFATRVGTPVFMSPECFARNFDCGTDMWSAGVMLYQLIAYRFPFWSSMEDVRSQTLEEVMEAVSSDAIPYDYGPWHDMSAAGLDLVQRMLCRDPLQRITAAEAMQHRWFREQGVVPGGAANNIVTFAGGAGDAPAGRSGVEQRELAKAA